MATVTVVVAVLTGGCAGDSNGSDDRQGTGIIDDSTPLEPETPAAPSPRSGEAEVVDSAACDEVRAGIDAFNGGEFDETVEHFRAALPLAEEQDDGSVLASRLIEAVRYYAELDAERYPDAARSSPEFAKYRAITLGQCVAGNDAAPEQPSAEV